MYNMYQKLILKVKVNVGSWDTDAPRMLFLEL